MERSHNYEGQGKWIQRITIHSKKYSVLKKDLGYCPHENGHINGIWGQFTLSVSAHNSGLHRSLPNAIKTNQNPGIDQ